MDEIGAYLRDVSARAKYYTREEERALVERYRAGDMAARDALVHSVLPLAVGIARRISSHYPDNRIALEDAFCAANECVLRCVECLDPDKGRLTTVVCKSVPRAVRKQMQDHGFTVRLPTNRWHDIDLIRDHAAKFSASLNADDATLGGDCSTENRMMGDCERSRSTDETCYFDSDDSAWALRLRLFRAIASLPHRMQFLLHRRFWEGATLEVVGREMRLSRERVRQIEKSALRIVRDELGDDAGAGEIARLIREREVG